MFVTKKKGLSEQEAKDLLIKFGPNTIQVKKKDSALKILISQFTQVLILILLASAIILFFLGESLDAWVILAIVIVNGLIGFSQEYKANKAVDLLKQMLDTKIIVIRDSQEKEINVNELVPGDLVVLYEGNIVPADIEIIEAYSLKVDEAALTGESMPVEKDAKTKNMVFSGTTIVSGKAMGIVKKTGNNTEFAKIVKLIGKKEKEKSVLNKQIEVLSKNIILFLIIILVFIVILGLIKGQNHLQLFLIAVSLAVAAIPEGLPIVITLTLSTGTLLMAKKNAIVRKMTAIDSLGATTVICTDKTGTLTLNEITVQKVSVFSETKEIEGVGYSPEPHIKINNPDILKLIDIGENCNNAIVENGIIGDPLEIALKVLAKKSNYVNDYKLLNEISFSSERKMMSTVHEISGTYELFSKGAFEEIIKHSTKILINGKIQQLTQEHIDIFTKLHEKYSRNALRVLAFAYKPLKDISKIDENNLVFVGICGMIDPPRTDVKSALESAQKAGIKIKIITGDNAITAQAIAKQVGFPSYVSIDAKKLDALDDKSAIELIRKTDIFARANPEHKYRIVDLLKKDGEVVAVTGDGINDAPALKHADVGIAMGIKGTQATREVADVVLKDDSFSSIVVAIEEGRRIYDNIVLFIKYMLAANFSELFVVGLFIIFNLPLPFLALQILWLNLITDSLPAIALGMRPAMSGIMQKKPREKNENIFKQIYLFLIIGTILQIIGGFVLFSYGMHIDSNLGIDTFDLSEKSYARTMLLSAGVLFEIFLAIACNSDGKYKFKSLFSNRWLNYSVLLVLGLQLFVVYTPFMQTIFKLAPLSFGSWVYCLIYASSSFLVYPIVNGIQKLFKK